nr:immunoglobulin heavy chain junction region [Macaca mulatta]MOV48910.1 immunoglobulin heavy chain junction region [Macaca mulatta]MOV49206.1 immunoglobulin heavy chain junction region [Macaca mulatta]MOV49440.1 immunoglobulin heavy chain junction region [Macaca mulatta]MOV50179.1 immunoglobulin heavy chain junction region [Macaca mulatta]
CARWSAASFDYW